VAVSRCPDTPQYTITRLAPAQPRQGSLSINSAQRGLGGKHFAGRGCKALPLSGIMTFADLLLCPCRPVATAWGCPLHPKERIALRRAVGPAELALGTDRAAHWA
jgi:hypothetical protein